MDCSDGKASRPQEHVITLVSGFRRLCFLFASLDPLSSSKICESLGFPLHPSSLGRAHLADPFSTPFPAFPADCRAETRMAEGPLSASLFSLFFASVPPFPLPLPTCGLMKSASLKCREEALSSSDIRDVLPLPFPSFPPFPKLSPFLPPFGLGGTAAGGICVGSGEAFTLGLAIETSLRALEFPLTSTHSCRSCASNMGLLLFSGWRKGEMAADLGDDLEDIAGEAYFDGTAAICGETLETLDARRLRRASSFSASASSCT